jgi:acetyltransferase-like isoleucine patch superfamily enzyme
VTPESVSVGDDCFFGPGLYVSAEQGLQVGNGVMLGPQVMILGGDHDYRSIGVLMRFSQGGGRSGRIVIEDDVWIGGRCIILKGVQIGRGSVIGAGSIVTRTIPPFSVAAGNPCRVIRQRFSSEELVLHLASLSSRRSEDE